MCGNPALETIYKNQEVILDYKTYYKLKTLIKQIYIQFLKPIKIFKHINFI